MRDYSDKKHQAIEACEKAINGIEDETLTVGAALLLCKKIARLVNDYDAIEWLNYEYGGYPDKDGIQRDAWDMAVKHGRLCRSKDKNGKMVEYIFTELCGELEETIDSNKRAINNYSTQGFSVSGEQAYVSTNSLTRCVAQQTNDLLKTIRLAERRLSILKSQYYDYAVRWQIELKFGKAVSTIFEEYQEKVDLYYSSLPTSIIQKLSAIQELMGDDNTEHYAQVLTSCRRLWSETAKALFAEVLPGYSEVKYITKSGAEIDVSGDHVNNMLSAIIENLQPKSVKNTLVGSEITYLIDWIENINKKQNTGVHAEVTKEQASQCIIHTYIALGDILSLKAAADKENNDPIISL